MTLSGVIGVFLVNSCLNFITPSFMTQGLGKSGSKSNSDCEPSKIVCRRDRDYGFVFGRVIAEKRRSVDGDLIQKTD